MRINVDDVALRDPDINRRLPRHTGLSRFDAFGRLVHVWGLAYDRRSAVLLMEDVDDVAEHDGFAAGMVLAGIADQVDPNSIRVHGVDDRIAYLIAAAESGRRGGETRAKQAAAGGREGGKFSKGPTSRPLVDDQGSTKGSTTPPLDLHHTSGSGSGSAPDPDLISLSLGSPPGESVPTPAPAHTPAPAFAPVSRLVTLAAELLNAARAEVDRDARPITVTAGDEMAAAGHLRTLPEVDREPAIRHGVAVLAELVRVGKRPIGDLRPGELFGPRSWGQHQANSVESIRATARGRDGPAGRAPPRKTGMSAALAVAARIRATDPATEPDP